jgi:uncharacterized membrane protein (DUF106 family)
MKRTVVLMAVVLGILASQIPARAQIFMGPNSARQAQKAAKKQQKAAIKAARKQQKAMQKIDKQHRKAAKRAHQA